LIFLENPMLRDMEEDAVLAADRAGLDINELPIDICKREILLRQQLVGGNTTIEVQNPILPNGEGVKNNKQLKTFLNN